jgi:hypothetical protein
MSKIALSGNASGTGTFTFAAPGTNTDRTLTLPDAAGTMVLADATQTLTNKTIQGGAITLGTAVASTSGTAIDFTGIPSWAKRVTVMLNGVSTNGTSSLRFQLGDSGGIETTGYFAWGQRLNAADTTGGASTSGFEGHLDSFTAFTRSGQLIFSLFGSNTWTVTGGYYAGSNVSQYFAGSKTLSDTLDRVRITTANGTDTFDAGAINISYEG